MAGHSCSVGPMFLLKLHCTSQLKAHRWNCYPVLFICLMLLYCTKPPNNKAPKCTLFSRVKGRKGSMVLPRPIASIVGGSLLRRAHFESLRAAEAKNTATINHLMSKRQSVLYFPYSTLFSRVKGHKGSPVLPRLLPSFVMGSLLRRAHFESLTAAEATVKVPFSLVHYGTYGLGQIKHSAAPRALLALDHTLVQYLP